MVGGVSDLVVFEDREALEGVGSTLVRNPANKKEGFERGC